MENNNRQGCRWVGEWQRCPVCDGNGQILADGFISSVYQQCPACSGQRMIQRPFNESIEPCATSSEIENDELKAWKESAISVMPDIQAIGKEMGLEIGQAISPKILPYIKELKKDRDWFMEAHNYLLKEAAEYSTKSEKIMIDLETEATDQKLKQESLVIEIEQEKAVSKAWQKVAEEKEKECERWKKTTERFKAEGDKWLNKSISLSKQIAELKSSTPSPTGDRECEELKHDLDLMTMQKELGDEANEELKKEVERLKGLCVEAFKAGDRFRKWIYHGNGQPPKPPDVNEFKKLNNL